MSIFGGKPGRSQPARGFSSRDPLGSPPRGGKAKPAGPLQAQRGPAAAPRTPPGTSPRFRASGLVTLLRPVNTADRVLFLKQLALTLRAGLSLTEALDVCREQAGNLYLAAAIRRMTAAIQSGASLSKAMTPERRYFSQFVVRLVETAEASGEMDSALDQIAQYLDQRAQLRSKVVTSLMYPSFIILTAFGVTAFLTVKVLPKFAAFLAKRQVELPWTTQLLLDVASFVSTYGLMILLASIAGLLLLAGAYLTRTGRFVLDRLTLAVPLVGGLVMVAHLALLSRTLAMLLRSGVTLLESLPIAAGAMMNRAISHRVEHASGNLLRGASLSESLRDRALPQLFLHVVAVGERTGNLSRVLDELADHYAAQLQTRLQRFIALIEPALLIVVGIIVGFVYQSFFHTVVQISTRRG